MKAKAKVRVSLTLVISIFATSSVWSAEAVVPFIKSEFWKQNISLDDFRSNPRLYFRSESAFNQLMAYLEGRARRPISDSEFIALVRDDTQTRVRDCRPSEIINTGAMHDGGFHWFERKCRPGEQIVQFKLDGVWTDFASLNCLNAVEDKTRVQPPLLGAVPQSTAVSPLPIQRSTFSDIVPSGTGTFQPGLYLPGNVCGGKGLFIPGTASGMGDTIESRGYSRTGEYYNDY